MELGGGGCTVKNLEFVKLVKQGCFVVITFNSDEFWEHMHLEGLQLLEKVDQTSYQDLLL